MWRAKTCAKRSQCSSTNVITSGFQLWQFNVTLTDESLWKFEFSLMETSLLSCHIFFGCSEWTLIQYIKSKHMGTHCVTWNTHWIHIEYTLNTHWIRVAIFFLGVVTRSRAVSKLDHELQTSKAQRVLDSTDLKWRLQRWWQPYDMTHKMLKT